MLPFIVNLLGATTAGLCALLLLRAYLLVKSPLLLWSGLCFVGLGIVETMVIVDLAVIRQADLYVWRLAIAASSLLMLVYGLILESD